jgi:hypothetical protein
MGQKAFGDVAAIVFSKVHPETVDLVQTRSIATIRRVFQYRSPVENGLPDLLFGLTDVL